MFLLNCSEQFNKNIENIIFPLIWTIWASDSQKNKNSWGWTKITGSYKKKKVYSLYLPAKKLPLSLSNENLQTRKEILKTKKHFRFQNIKDFLEPLSFSEHKRVFTFLIT